MTSPLISVIVPVYNVEQYVSECVRSILNQTYTNLEILLVDDGSTDRSTEICQELLELDSRIRYFIKENGGLSDARNYGIERVSGEYIIFVDSDDWLESGAIQLLYDNMIKYHSDMAIASYYQYREEDCTFLFHISGEHYYEKVYTPQQIFHDFSKLTGFDASFVVAWAKLFKKKLFDHIRFREGSYTEDEAINYRLIQECESIVYVNQAIYGYRRRSGTLSQEKNKKFIEDTLRNLEERIAILAITNGDVSGFLPHYRGRLLGFEYDMRENWGMADTELYRRVKENLYLIEKYGNLS